MNLSKRRTNLWRVGTESALGVLILTGAVFQPVDIVHGAAAGRSAAAITVKIDIKPGDEPTSIDPNSAGMLPVAVLTTDEFDASSVDPASVRFGATGTEAAPFRSALDDVDDDGDKDMMFLFRLQQTGIECGHTSATLKGKTAQGEGIEGSESFKTQGCP